MGQPVWLSHVISEFIINFPLVTNFVIPETILIGNPAFNYLKLWIPDKDIRG